MNGTASLSPEQLLSALANAPMGVVVVGADCVVRWANGAAAEMVGVRCADDLAGCHCGKYFCELERPECPILKEGIAICNHEEDLEGENGRKIRVSRSVKRIELDDGPVLVETLIDLSRRSGGKGDPVSAVHRMETLLALIRMGDRPDNELVAQVVEDAIRMTESEIGYLATVNADEDVLTMESWSRSAHARCEMADKRIVHPLKGTGLWGEAIRQRKPIITNDYGEPNPYKRGIPDGHVALRRHMNVPIIHGGRIVAVAGVGNKATDYNEQDLRQLQLLLECWWQIVVQKHSAEELRAYTLALESANRALEDFNQIAESATRAKSQFLANMSHEIRTPMTAILGFTDLLLDGLTSPPEVEAARTIKRNGRHLLELINDILDLSKVEAGKIDVEPVAWPPCTIVSEVVELMRGRAEAKGVALVAEFEGPLPETIRTDPMRLRQILVNLVGNAIKFTDVGGIRIGTRLVSDDRGGSLLEVEIADTGIGIAEAELQRIFQPFTQVDASASRKYEGTGLGLAISRQLARLLGGSVTARSEPGKGSVFTVTVDTGPLENVSLIPHRRHDETGGPSLESPLRISGRKVAGRILLAEDNADNRRLIAAILRSAGADVLVAENGREAVEMALGGPQDGRRESGNADRKCDIILMDVQMPVMDGIQAMQWLRKEGYGGPIVAMTAHAMRGDREACLSVGFDEYLAKPLDFAKLFETMLRWMPDGDAAHVANDGHDEQKAAEKVESLSTGESVLAPWTRSKQPLTEKEP